MSDYGVTASGFQKKRFDTIYNEVRDDLLAGLGVDIAQNPQSVINVISATYVDRLARLWDLAEAVYNSQFPGTATGVALDNALSYANVKRRVAVPSTYNVLLVQAGGSIGLYTVGTQAASQGDDTRYMSLSKQVFLQADSGYPMSYWLFTCPSTVGTNITVNMDGGGVSFTTTGNVASDNQALKNQLYQPPETSYFMFDTVGADNKIAIYTQSRSVPRTIYWQNLTLVEGGVYGLFSDNTPEKAAYNGLVTVTTTNPIIRAECRTKSIGEVYESDEDYRKRYMRLLATRGSASPDAIRGHVLEVAGVGACDVVENTQDTMQNGIPAHGIKVYVEDETGSTFDNTEVGQAIFDSMAAGINMATSGISVMVTDYSGNIHLVYFNVPTPVSELVQISITASGTLAGNYSTVATSVFMEAVGTPMMGDAVDLQAIAVKIKDAIIGAGYVEVACKQMGDVGYGRKFLPSVLGTKYTFSAGDITVITV